MIDCVPVSSAKGNFYLIRNAFEDKFYYFLSEVAEELICEITRENSRTISCEFSNEFAINDLEFEVFYAVTLAISSGYIKDMVNGRIKLKLGIIGLDDSFTSTFYENI